MNSSPFSRNRAVAIWIIIGVGMLLFQVILGGITRLTGSGLSITEWNVVTGTLPPFSDSQWQIEFEKYQQTPQYQILNTSFTLSDFKFIFFWEWFHRFWARLIGIVFIIGFIYLVATKKLKKEMQLPLLILFLLGALQGAVGWIMVASGLTGDAVYVKPTRLALHFIFALGLIAYAFWFALQLVIPKANIVQAPRIHRFTIWLIAGSVVQLIFGALMAGHRAAMAAPTWPDINGYFLPPAGTDHGLFLNLIEDKLLVHFIHRNLAYILTILFVIFTIRISKIQHLNGVTSRSRYFPIALIVVQVVFGIGAILTSRQIVPNHWGSFEWMAQLHQVVGMLLLLSLVLLLFLFRKNVR